MIRWMKTNKKNLGFVGIGVKVIDNCTVRLYYLMYGPTDKSILYFEVE